MKCGLGWMCLWVACKILREISCNISRYKEQLAMGLLLFMLRLGAGMWNTTIFLLEILHVGESDHPHTCPGRNALCPFCAIRCSFYFLYCRCIPVLLLVDGCQIVDFLPLGNSSGPNTFYASYSVHLQDATGMYNVSPTFSMHWFFFPPVCVNYKF